MSLLIAVLAVAVAALLLCMVTAGASRQRTPGRQVAGSGDAGSMAWMGDGGSGGDCGSSDGGGCGDGGGGGGD